MKGEEMKNQLEFDFELREMLGLTNTDERSRMQSVQKSTDAIDGFFEHLEIKKTLGSSAEEFEKLIAERISRPDHEPIKVSEFREFVKTEKARVPSMTPRQVASL